MSRNNLNSGKELYEGYYFEDEFLYFTFNDRYSKIYNLFIVNNGDDLQLTSDTGASSSYESPLLGNMSYYQGTSNNQRTFSYTLAAGGLTLPRYREMMLWLAPGQKGFFRKDYDGYWGHEVVVDSIGAVKRYGNSDEFNVEFTINFKTIGIPYARPDTDFVSARAQVYEGEFYQEGRNLVVEKTSYTVKEEEGIGLVLYILPSTEVFWGSEQSTIFNEYGMPEIIIREGEEVGSTRFILPQVNNKFSYIDLSFNRTQQDAYNISVKANNTEILVIKLNKEEDSFSGKRWMYYGDSGLVLDESGFLDSNDGVSSIEEDKGIFPLPCNSPEEITNFTFTQDPTYFYIDVGDEVLFNSLNNKYGSEGSFVVMSNKSYINGLRYDSVVDDYKSLYANAHYTYSYALNEGETFFDEERKKIKIPKTADFSNCQPKLYFGFYNTIDVDSKSSVNGIFIHKYNNL